MCLRCSCRARGCTMCIACSYCAWLCAAVSDLKLYSARAWESEGKKRDEKIECVCAFPECYENTVAATQIGGCKQQRVASNIRAAELASDGFRSFSLSGRNASSSYMCAYVRACMNAVPQSSVFRMRMYMAEYVLNAHSNDDIGTSSGNAKYRITLTKNQTSAESQKADCPCCLYEQRASERGRVNEQMKVEQRPCAVTISNHHQHPLRRHCVYIYGLCCVRAMASIVCVPVFVRAQLCLCSFACIEDSYTHSGNTVSEKISIGQFGFWAILDASRIRSSARLIRWKSLNQKT